MFDYSQVLKKYSVCFFFLFLYPSSIIIMTCFSFMKRCALFNKRNIDF